MFRSCNFALIFRLKCNAQSKCTALGKTYWNAPKRASSPSVLKQRRFDNPGQSPTRLDAKNRYEANDFL